MPDEATPQVEMTETVVETPTAQEPETETVEEFDKDRAMATIKNLRGFEKQAKQLEKQLSVFQKQEEERKRAEMSEIDRLKADLEERDNALKSVQLLELKRQVAKEFELPEALASRLQGEDLDALKADAAALSQEIPKQKPQPKISIMNPGSTATGETRDERNRRLGLA